MPILDDIMDHDVLGPVLRQGREEGLAVARRIIRRSLEVRFGIVPAGVDARLASLSAPELEALHDRIPEVTHIKELFPDSK
jgi:hypothetical protein